MKRTRKRQRLGTMDRLLLAAQGKPRLLIVSSSLLAYGDFCDEHKLNPYLSYDYRTLGEALGDAAENRRRGGPPAHIVILDESDGDAKSATQGADRPVA